LRTTTIPWGMGGGIWPCCSGACTVFPQVGGQHLQLLLALFAAFNASYKLSSSLSCF
jgi:hypothetical protein